MSFRRTAAVLAAALATLVAVPASHASARTPTTTSPEKAAAGWLARQLLDGERLQRDGFDDQGLTIDALFAFDAAGVARDNSDKMIAWLAKPDVIEGYVTDGEGGEYPAPIAKLALAAQAQGKDPRAFGGVDLITRLGALLDPGTGRYRDKSDYEDTSNNFGQAFAVLVLTGAGGAPAKAVDFLAGSACPDGGFPLYPGLAECKSDVDSTGMVVQALLKAGRTEAATKALDWLVAKQTADGGFSGTPPTGTVNANSTGLAAQALRAGGRSDAATKAGEYLTGLQVGCSGEADRRGAIPYDATAFTPAGAVRATPQAITGLVGVNFADLSPEGDAGPAPAPDCQTTTSTTTPTSTTTATTTADPGTTTTDPTTTSAEDTTTTTTDEVAPVVYGGTGSTLAYTGVDVAPALWLGTLLLLAGVLTTVLARKRFTTAKERRR
ncbi:prenyltransferase/squalene oxidase repeat-containing protein [Actinosynnema sp. NPDC020468]|uniref:prenyltransferase/squalene oxidase repeat-containing protein n=1 Tax=Actinosynnema sp. NPDC020468 TaxID=3154488 RepID=UPI0033D05A91